MSEEQFLKHSGVFELFGLDFMLDNELKLWFIECNSSPQYIGTNKVKTEMLTTMLKDMFEIEYALLRSRTKRIMDLIKVYKQIPSKTEADTQKFVERYAFLNKNSFELEYQPSPTNSWHKIIDRMTIADKKDQYMGLIHDDCIDI